MTSDRVAEDGCWGWLLFKGCWGWLLFQGCSSNGSSTLIFSSFSTSLCGVLVFVCCAPRAALRCLTLLRPRVDTFDQKEWSCRGNEPKLGPLPPSWRTSLGKVGFEKERPADLPPVPGGARRCHVSWKEKIKLFVMRFRAKGFRDQRAVKLQEGEQWPNQMHAVPQPVGKMQRDCLRQKGPRWECGVNDSSKDPWSSKVVWKGVAGTTARRKYETGTSYKKAEGEASRSSWSAPAAPATSPRAITDVIKKI